jgi:hypothetical protein
MKGVQAWGESFPCSRRKRYLFSVTILWLGVFIWGLAEKEPEKGRGYYGNVMRLQDRGAAEMFGVDEPGIYVVNKNHKPVTAVRGGLGMVLRGVAAGDGDQVEVGFRGIGAGLVETTEGVLLLVLASVSVLGWIPILILKSRSRTANAKQSGHDES